MTFRTNPIKNLGILAIGFLFVVVVAAPASAQESILAIGKVQLDGTLVKSAHTLGAGATVASVRTGAGLGHYTITLTSAGAFAGTSPNSFLPEVTIRETASGDQVAKATVASVTSNVLKIDVQIDDVEDAAAPSAAVPLDHPFAFSVYRMPAAFSGPGFSRFLEAAGTVDAAGNLLGAAGVKGIAVTSSRSGTGDYEIRLTKAGAFSGVSANNFVLLLSARGTGTEDRGVRGDLVSVTNDVVSFQCRVDELQDETDDNSAVPIDDQFCFTIYRTRSSTKSGRARSKLLTALGRVDGSAAGVGPLLSGGAFGGTVSKNRLGTGSYQVTITSPGRFAGKAAGQFALQLAIDHGASSDRAITGSLAVVSADTIQVNVNTNDVEEAGQSEGVATDSNFFFSVYEASASLQPDLRIGRQNDLSLQLGNEIYNTSGDGQKIRIRLRKKRKKKYYFSLENDGNLIDDFPFAAGRSGKRVKVKYYRLTGGRQNITAAVSSGGYVLNNLRPCKIVKYEAKARFKTLKRRPVKKLYYFAISRIQPAKVDLNRIKLIRR